MSQGHNRVKLWALLLLVLNLCLFIAVLFAQRYGVDHPALGYLKAFAEAACIGALADWFAVVALFRHPLGIPLPHTAILPAKQAQLAKGVATFISTHFLDAKVISDQLVRLHVGERLHAYAQNKLTAQWIEQRLPNLLQALMRRVPVDVPERLLASSQAALNDYMTGERVARMLALIINAMTEQGIDKKMVNALAASVNQFVTAPDAKERVQPWLNNVIQAAQKSDASWWGKIKGQFTGQALEWADDWIVEQALAWLADFTTKIQKDENHPAHALFQRHMCNWQEQLLNNPHWQDWLEAHTKKWLSGETASHWMTLIWHKIRKWLDEQVQEGSAYMALLATQIRAIALSYLGNSEQQHRLNEGVGQMAASLLTEHQADLRNWLAEQMNAWSKERLTNALESAIGRDLQYIRINGTLIGGLIGLILYVISQLV